MKKGRIKEKNKKLGAVEKNKKRKVVKKNECSKDRTHPEYVLSRKENNRTRLISETQKLVYLADLSEDLGNENKGKPMVFGIH